MNTQEIIPRADFTIDQPVERYTDADHSVWQTLYERQSALLEGRACDAYLAGLHALNMGADRVPVFAELNQRLMAG